MFGPLTIYEGVKVWSRWIAFTFSLILMAAGVLLTGLGFYTLRIK